MGKQAICTMRQNMFTDGSFPYFVSQLRVSFHNMSTKMYTSLSTQETGTSSKSEVEHAPITPTTTLLNSSTGTRIENPLADVSRDELMRQVAEFAGENGLLHALPLLQKGALVAQRPTEWDAIPELDEDDRAALEYEFLHKWRQTKDLYITILVCSVGAAVQ